MMRVAIPLLAVCGLFGAGASWAQVAASPAAVSPAAVTAAAPVMKSASVLLQPGLDGVRAALREVRVEKWKTSGAVREEMDGDLGSIQRDLDGTLPGLLSAADSAPDSVGKVLPAYRNVEALYDVLLRVASVARLAAPQAQSAALDGAMADLERGRRMLGDQLQSSAVAVEKQVVDLRAALKAVPAPAPVPARAVTKKKVKPGA